jgi:hypothetical protein
MDMRIVWRRLVGIPDGCISDEQVAGGLDHLCQTGQCTRERSV